MHPGERTLRYQLQHISEILDNPKTTEVVVTKPGVVGCEQEGYWFWHDVPALTYDVLETIAILSARMEGKDIRWDNPSCVSKLPGGQRIKMMMPPAVTEGTVSLTIRQRALWFTPTLEWLDEHDYFSALDPSINWPAWFRERAIHARKTVVISGEIGSGKTTMAEALVRAIPEGLRIVTIEGSSEWQDLPQKNWQATFFNEADPESAVRRVQDAMQARPDWLPFQELRGEEAWALLRALKVGTPSIATAHAPDAAAVFESIESMIRQSGPGRMMDAADIRKQLRQYIGIVVHCVRILPTESGQRTIYRANQVLEVGATPAEDRLHTGAL